MYIGMYYMCITHTHRLHSFIGSVYSRVSVKPEMSMTLLTLRIYLSSLQRLHLAILFV